MVAKAIIASRETCLKTLFIANIGASMRKIGVASELFTNQKMKLAALQSNLVLYLFDSQSFAKV
jgi:hypothetical protein